MIDEFVAAWNSRKEELRAIFEKNPPGQYHQLVRKVVERMPLMDASRIKEIDFGNCQGTIVYVVGAAGYQPSRHWVVKISYGSCSHCDSLQACESADDYLTLALHIVQQFQEI